MIDGDAIVRTLSTTQADFATDLARRLGYVRSEAVDAIGDAERYTVASPRRVDPLEFVDALSAVGVTAQPNHVVELSGRSKWAELSADSGDDIAAGPRPTAWRPATRAAHAESSGACMVVIDGDADHHSDTIRYGPAHATFVSGIVQQVAPTAHIHVVHAFDEHGLSTDATLAAAIVLARDTIDAHGGRGVINLSCSAITIDGAPLLATTVALSTIDSERILVVAAAGNDGTTNPEYPAALDTVVAVGALQLHPDQLLGAEWSNHGDWIDISTIGEGIISTMPAGRIPGTDLAWTDDDPYAIWSGTSFAAPQVAARLAHLLTTHPHDRAAAVVKLLADDPTATDIPGYGTALRIL